MPEATQFDEFMNRVLNRPLPNNRLLQVQLYARELAEGALDEYWEIHISPSYRRMFSDSEEVQRLANYIERRWQNNPPDHKFLRIMGYIDKDEHLTRYALQLVYQVNPLTCSYLTSARRAAHLHYLFRNGCRE